MGTNAGDASSTERGRRSAVQRLNEVLWESRRLRRELELFIPRQPSDSSLDFPEALTDVDV
jgi:hypothetical protein